MRKTVVKSFAAMTAIAMIASGFSPEEVRAEENLELENVIIGQSSEMDLEKEDPEYGEKNDLANSFRYEDGKPIPAESRYTQYSTWPKDIPGTVGYGIDVSKHQGKINWEKVNNSGVDYAIIRCGYGQDQYNQDDEYWDINAKACEQYGIPYGTYLYSYADTVEKAASEAKHVLRLVEGYDLSYPIYYDLEESSVRSKLNKSQIADIAETFCSIIEEAGYEAAIYSSKDWFENYLTDSRFNQWDRWVAQYNTQCTYRGEYTMWQCSSKGYVDGIDGYADLNIDFGAALNYTEEPYLVEENGKIYCYCKGEKLFGEQKVEGYWYYFDEKNDGEMATGWRDIPVKTGGTKTVYYNEDGRMTYGEKKIDGSWYYFNKITGARVIGFVELPGKTVYYGEDGKMLYNDQMIDGYQYYFDPVTGKRLENSWRGKKYYDEAGRQIYGEKKINGYWYYFDEEKNGDLITGWRNIAVKAGGNKTVYYDKEGHMQYGEKKIDGYWYYFDKVTGARATGWKNITTKAGKLKSVYYNANGQMLYGEQKIGGYWYYFDKVTGEKITNATVDGHYYDKDGKRIR